MRRLVLAGLLLLLLVLQGAPTAQGPAPGRSLLQADAVVRLIADLESALASGRQEELGGAPGARVAGRRCRAPAQPRRARAVADRSRSASARAGRIEQGFEVLTEVLVS